MPIKKSELEKKWYYRVVRVFLLILPLLVAVVVVWGGYVDISFLFKKNALAILQKNNVYITYVVAGLVVYYLILKLIWWVFLYVVFGGLEDDTIKKIEGAEQKPAGQPVGQAMRQGALSEEDKKQVGFYLFLLIMVGLIYWIYTYTPAQNWIPGRSNGDSTKKSTCIPTGCGSQWYCSGSYYDANGTRRSLNGCLLRKAGETYSSWSGTCRQCP